MSIHAQQQHAYILARKQVLNVNSHGDISFVHSIAKMADIPVEENNVNSTDGNRRDLERHCDEPSTLDEKYDPSHEKCGDNIVFRENRMIASQKNNSITGRIAFSGKLVSLDEVFKIKVTGRRS